CTFLTLASVIASALFAILRVPWWLTAAAAVVGVLAFLMNSTLRKHWRTVTRPMTLQREYRLAWLLIGAGVAGTSVPKAAPVVALTVLIGVGLIVMEPKLAPYWGSLSPSVRNLPGVQRYTQVRIIATTYLLLELIVTVALFFVPAVGSAGTWVALLLVGLGAALAVGTTAFAR